MRLPAAASAAQQRLPGLTGGRITGCRRTRRERYDVVVEAGESLVRAMERGKKRAAELALESDKPAQLPPVIDLVPV